MYRNNNRMHYTVLAAMLALVLVGFLLLVLVLSTILSNKYKNISVTHTPLNALVS